MGVKFDILTDALRSKLSKMENYDFSNVLTDACLLVENDAKRNAPVATGQLRLSITHEVSGTEGTVGTSLFYAPYVEYGTGLFSSQGNGRKDVPWYYKDAAGNWHSTCGRQPKPFLIPAFDANKENIKQMFEKAIKEMIG